MKIKLIIALALCLTLSCKEENPSTNIIKPTQNMDLSNQPIQFEGYHKIAATEIPDNMIQLIGQDWMLITAGNKDAYNTMTASWGGFGELWGMNVGMVVVRDIRYTHEFMDKEKHYTMSFFSEDYRGALKILGSRSGRDGDKVKDAGLEPLETPLGNMSFKQARMIIECKKIYADPIKKDAFIDSTIYSKWYNKESTYSMHTLFIGEIVNVWVK